MAGGAKFVYIKLKQKIHAENEAKMTKEHGRNQARERSLNATVAPDGRAISGRDYTIPACAGVAVVFVVGDSLLLTPSLVNSKSSW